MKNESAAIQYERQLELCVEVLSAHTGQRLNRRALQNAAVSVAQARQEMTRLIRLDWEKPYLLPASWRMLALNSYYAADDIRRWTRMLAQLNNRLIISQRYRRHQYHGNVLLVGSPVYFPNYKIPFLLEDVGLHIAAHIDYTTQKIKTALSAGEAANITLSSLARRFYLEDCSGSYAKNEGLQTAVSEALDDRDIDGVVCCVLKGQIEYDFELERLETRCNERNIPVFRLETDYNQQDVEQLRIRMEAFSEMLRQRQFQRGVAV